MIIHASLSCNFRGFSLTCLLCVREVAFQIHSAPLFEPLHRISGLRPPHHNTSWKKSALSSPTSPLPSHCVQQDLHRHTESDDPWQNRPVWNMFFASKYLVFLFVSVSLHIFFQMLARVKTLFHFTSGAAAQSIHRSSDFKRPKNFTASYSPAFFKSYNPSSLQQKRDTSRHPATPRIISSSEKNKWQGNVFLLLFVEDTVSVQMSKFDFKRAHPPPWRRLGRWFPAF